MIYPYLGKKDLDEKKCIVVFFTEENKGVVISLPEDNNEYTFGKYDKYNEDEFDLLDEELCVRLHN